jgi:hypothetical protein
MLFRYAVVTVTLLCFTACTTMQPIEDFTPATVHQHVEAGERVHVVLASGAVYDLVVTKVEADSLVGRADSGKHWRIKYDAIRQIEAEEPDAFNSVAAGIGGAVVVLYVVTLIAVVAFFDSLDDE